MAIKINNKEIGNAFIGSTSLGAIFCGDKLVWSSGIKLQLNGNAIKGTKYGIVDMGTLNWFKQNNGNFNVYAPNGKGTTTVAKTDIFNGYCQRYTSKGFYVVHDQIFDKSIRGYFFNDSYPCQLSVYDSEFLDKTADEFKSSLDRVFLIYELALPSGDKLADLTAEQIYNLLTLNGTDFANLELLADGYEVKLKPFGISTNGNIKSISNSKYAFVDMGTLNWYNEDYVEGRWKAETTRNLAKGNATNVVGNIFSKTHEAITYSQAYNGTRGISVATNGDIRVFDTSYSSATDFASAMSGKYLCFELATSLGSKLDDYNAEQVHNLFVGTIATTSTKKYAPKGKKIELKENSNTIIKGTKYGVIDLGDLSWNFNTNRFISDRLANLSAISKPTTPNIYVKGYKIVTGNYFDNHTSEDLMIRVDDDFGRFVVRNLSYTDGTALKQALKGTYLIYELSTQDGTEYEGLSAKQMYDLIQDSHFEKLSTDKSIVIGGLEK